MMLQDKVLQHWNAFRTHWKRRLVTTVVSMGLFLGLPMYLFAEYNNRQFANFQKSAVLYEPLQIYMTTLGYNSHISKTKGQTLPAVREKRRMLLQNNELVFELISMRHIVKQNEDLLAQYKARNFPLNPLRTKEIEKEVKTAETSAKQSK